ncbi:hypothetical protein [Nitrosophilus alvini]|uniref:hypothetical protein n=1 Tax=Nitrosophilus alvini TaxID=2714855 RepID=UPI001909062D|nr:hypothetical protein [Nitrosophilus alvini]
MAKKQHKNMIKECIYCKNEKLYRLKSGQLKCSKCKKKMSPKKIALDTAVIEAFCSGLNAYECSKKIGANYATVKKRYDLFRKKIALFLEEEYQKKKEVKEFDEYMYLERSKRKEKKYIFDAQNFLTFDYGGKVYNLLMPDLKKYKSAFLQDGIEDVYYNQLSQFLRFNKIAKLEKRLNLITEFWDFFEEFIVKFKGVESENFFYYLKEAEFKFNYTIEEQKEILARILQ